MLIYSQSFSVPPFSSLLFETSLLRSALIRKPEVVRSTKKLGNVTTLFLVHPSLNRKSSRNNNANTSALLPSAARSIPRETAQNRPNRIRDIHLPSDTRFPAFRSTADLSLSILPSHRPLRLLATRPKLRLLTNKTVLRVTVPIGPVPFGPFVTEKVTVLRAVACSEYREYHFTSESTRSTRSDRLLVNELRRPREIAARPEESGRERGLEKRSRVRQSRSRRFRVREATDRTRDAPSCSNTPNPTTGPRRWRGGRTVGERRSEARTLRRGRDRDRLYRPEQSAFVRKMEIH